MEIYTLEEVYPIKDNFITDMTTSVSNFYGSSVSVDNTILSFVLSSIYAWYISNYIIYSGSVQDVKSNFLKRFTFDLCDMYLYIEKKIKHFLSLDNESLFIKGGTTSHTDITPNLTNEVFTKQANTPSVVNQASDFVDEYTDYQSKTTSRHSGTDTHDTTLNRTGSQEDVLKIFSTIPKSLTEDLIDSVKYNFYIMGDNV